MSRSFRFTTKTDIGNEIEQYIYGKYGCEPSKALCQMVLTLMSKNPLTPQQSARIARKYGKDAVATLAALSGTAEGITEGGAS